MLPMLPVLWYNGPDSWEPKEERRSTRSEHYDSDLLFYFDGKPPGVLPVSASLCGHGASLSRRLGEGTEEPDQLLLPQAVCRRLHPGTPEKDWPRECLLVTFGLERQLLSPRIAVAVEPTHAGPTMWWYPGRRRSTRNCWTGSARPISSVRSKGSPAVSYIQYRTDRPS